MITVDPLTRVPRPPGSAATAAPTPTPAPTPAVVAVDLPSAIDVLVESFQKEAISCQFRENARQIALLEAEKSSVVKRAALLADGLTAIGGWWTEIADELLLLSAHLGLPINLNDALHKQDCSRPPFFSSLLSVEKEEPFENHLNAMYIEAQEIVASFIRHLACVKTPPLLGPCKDLSDELRTRYADLRHQLIEMERLYLTQQKELETHQLQLEEKTERIRQLEKTIDRLQCRTWTAVFLRPPPNQSASLSTPIHSSTAAPQTHTHAHGATLVPPCGSSLSPHAACSQHNGKPTTQKPSSSTPTASSIAENGNSMDAAAPDNRNSTDVEMQDAATCLGHPVSAQAGEEMLATSPIECSRIREIRALVSELIEVKQERDSLRLQNQVLPESILAAHPFVLSLRGEINTLSSQAQHWRQKAEELNQIQLQMREDHALWLQQHREIIATRECQFDSEQRKVHEEIVRLRKQRDEQAAIRETLQSERHAKLKHTESLHNHIKVKDSRITILESSLERAQVRIKKLAHFSNCDESVRVSAANASSKPVLNNCSLENGTVDCGAAAASSSSSSPSCLLPFASGTPSSSDLEVARQQVELLTAEVNAVSEGYAKLDQSLARDIVIIKDKEEYITKLIADKTKLDSKNLFLRKQCEQLKQEADLGRRSLETCREVQRLAEEKERAAITHMMLLEREIKWARDALGCHRDRALDVSHQFISTQHQAEAAEERHRVATLMLRDRTAEVEHLRYEKNRALEEAQLLASTATVAVANNDEDNLRLLESYRQILTCSTCKTRFKNTAIIRCMHTFCRQCVNDRLESRQRKCPTCGDSFGQNDVRTIYI